jgi:chromosome segregation ATPase
MAESAHLSSINALADFRAGLCTFMEEARNAVAELDMEIRRAVDWLDDQLRTWKEEVREAEDDMIRARSELSRRRLMRVGDRPPDTTEQEKNLARARQRLEFAQEELAATKHWLIVLPEELRLYQAPSRAFQDTVESDLPKVAALLERKIAALEAYAATMARPPKT